MENKKIYIVKSAISKDLEKQLTRTNETLNQKTTHYLFNKDRKVFRAGEIYECALTDNRNNTFIYPVIIMKNSSEYNTRVLICPLFKEEEEVTYSNCLNIGIIPSIDQSHSFAADIMYIRSVPKECFRLSRKNSLKELKPICNLSYEQYMHILITYRDLISEVIRQNSYYEANYIKGNRYLQTNIC